MISHGEGHFLKNLPELRRSFNRENFDFIFFYKGSITFVSVTSLLIQFLSVGPLLDTSNSSKYEQQNVKNSS